MITQSDSHVQAVRQLSCDITFSPTYAAGQTRSLIIADGTAPEILELLKGARVPYVILGETENPLQVMATVLAGEELDTLHIVAHGRPGGIRFGHTWIDTSTLRSHSNELANIESKRIALWSCEVDADRSFSDMLASLTGSTVFATSQRIYQHSEEEQNTVLYGVQTNDRLLSFDAAFKREVISDLRFELAEFGVIFGQGYVGTVGRNTQQADNILTFPTLGLQGVGFFQDVPDGTRSFFEQTVESTLVDVCWRWRRLGQSQPA